MTRDVQFCATRSDAPGRAEVTSYSGSARRRAEALRSVSGSTFGSGWPWALFALSLVPVVVGLHDLRAELLVAARAHGTAQLGARVWVARQAPGAIRAAYCAEHDPDRDGVVDCVATAVAGERVRVFPLRCSVRSPSCDASPER